MDFIAGEILYFDKPYEWSSFDVVNRVRGAICHHLGQKKLKVGHAGTLDPLATGVMIICTGKATKRIEELQYGVKEIRGNTATRCHHPVFRHGTPG